MAGPGAGQPPGFDVVAVLLVFLGRFVVPVLGWLAGVVMLWLSPRWSAEDKWLGTLTVPVVAVVGFLALAWDDGLGPAGQSCGRPWDCSPSPSWPGRSGACLSTVATPWTDVRDPSPDA